MTRAAIALALVLAAGPASAANPLDLANAALVIGDLAATEVILDRGGRELNPLMQERSARLAGAAARIAVSVYVPRFLEGRGHKNWARGFRIGAVIVNGAVVAHNLRQLKGR